MLRILLAVDGSPASLRATQKLVDSVDWYKERPQVDLLAVHLPLPKLPHMGTAVGHGAVERYYEEESAAMLASSRELLDKAGIQYAVVTRVGAVAETIVEHAKSSGSDLIYMGTRGMGGLANIVLGSVTMKVLHLATMPVVLVH